MVYDAGGIHSNSPRSHRPINEYERTKDAARRAARQRALRRGRRLRATGSLLAILAVAAVLLYLGSR